MSKLDCNKKLNECIICKESFDDECMQYIKCEGWTHVVWAHVYRPKKYYICDFCKNDF